MFKAFEFCLPTRATIVPNGPDWLHEVKYDGRLSPTNDGREDQWPTPSATQLSQVISQVTAPSFLLGAVAALVSVLIRRMNRTIDRLEVLSAVSDDDTSKGHPEDRYSSPKAPSRTFEQP
jgi:hypothetical protein